MGIPPSKRVRVDRTTGAVLITDAGVQLSADEAFVYRQAPPSTAQASLWVDLWNASRGCAVLGMLGGAGSVEEVVNDQREINGLRDSGVRAVGRHLLVAESELTAQLLLHLPTDLMRLFFGGGV